MAFGASVFLIHHSYNQEKVIVEIKKRLPFGQSRFFVEISFFLMNDLKYQSLCLYIVFVFYKSVVSRELADDHQDTSVINFIICAFYNYSLV